MATKKKMLQAAAGQAGGAGLDITDVFSTYLYEGTGSTSNTITNGIDLAGEGGLVWLKGRNNGNSNYLHDSERTITKWLQSQTTAAEQTNGPVTSFNSNGFSLGYGQGLGGANSSGDTFASWTFRKAPKFFDVVTYTGDGVAGRAIPHNLGSVPACIIVKNLELGTEWITYHSGADSTSPEDYYLYLNATNARIPDVTMWNSTAPTDTVFTVGSDNAVNRATDLNTYVAYLFAHNDGDGEFGPDADQDIIKCGSYTGNGSTDGPEIDLGFEPQWVMIKSSSNADNWNMYDNMRGVTGSSSDPRLVADQADAEITGFEGPQFNATGFKMVGTAISNGSGRNYIYIAIRRGPLAPPESGTEVFDVALGNGTSEPYFNSGFPVDFGVYKRKSPGSNTSAGTRLLQKTQLNLNLTDAEYSSTLDDFDYMDGFHSNVFGDAWVSWMWKRAPGFFDVVAYTGDGIAGRTVSHNLGVAPEMIWVKRRNSTGHWYVYHTGMTGGSDALHSTARLNLTEAGFDTQSWKNYDFTAAHFSLDNGADINASGGTYIAYLFATLAGVSKVFSVTKSSGSDASVDCGFTSGPRFVMLKRTDSTGDWYVWDTERGIVAGNDPYLLLNSTAAEVTSTDYIDPTSNGFTIVNGGLADGDYIGYAVA